LFNNVQNHVLGLELRTARPIENYCDYSIHQKNVAPVTLVEQPRNPFQCKYLSQFHHLKFVRKSGYLEMS